MITEKMIRHGDYTDPIMIRMAVFVDEQKFVNELDDLDDEGWHLVLYDDGVPVATARAFLYEDGLCKIGRVAVMPSHRGQHLGERLMQCMEAEMTKLGAKQFKVGAQVRASGFYAKQGYVRHGEEYLDEYCPHVDMYKPEFAE